MDKFCEERTSWPRPRIKLIIDVEKDYYEMIKYNVEHGQDYKTFEIIANGVPYNPTGDSISREGLKEVINDLFRSGEYDCNSVLKAIDNAPTVEYTFEDAFQQTVCEQRLYCSARPKGEWLPDAGGYQCNKCFDHALEINGIEIRSNFCPNCGADMRGEEE